MAEPHASPAPLERIHFGWLIRLRWVAIAGQLLVIFASSELLGVGLPLAPLGALLAFEVALNLGLSAWLRRASRVTPRDVALAIAADLLLFTALLYLTGGPSNPFSFLYLVHLALAAIMLPSRLGWALVLLSLVCSAALFADHVPLESGAAAAGEHAGHHDHAHHAHQHGASDGFDWHLRGMWVALGVAASFIVYFLRRVALELALRERLLADAREQIARAERLTSLGTLAAGAAHELGSPLATIAVAARELERSLGRKGADPSVFEDAKLIRTQVDRCHGILAELAADAGQPAAGSVESVGLDELVRSALERFASAPPVELDLPEPVPRLRVPAAAFVRALANLLSNAVIAAGPSGRVRLSAGTANDELRIVVEDSGPGMSKAVLERAAEPFFSTRGQGDGMGLGLFLARTVAEQLGGRLTLESQAERGTRATLILPSAALLEPIPGHREDAA